MDPIRFRGTSDGLEMSVEWGVPFNQVLSALENKLRSARNFFVGARVTVVGLAEEHSAQATDMLVRYGVDVAKCVPHNVSSDLPNIIMGSTVTVHGVMRGGQEAISEGTLVVMGDVNPGAELRAGGDIVVMGALKGKAYAGFPNNEAAYVAAMVMQPLQLRIADFIARSDESPDPGYPEIARVRNGQIVISPIKG